VASSKRGQVKMRLGTVVSDKMDKTVTVRVDRKVHHPQYGKVVRRSVKFKVHDKNNEAHAGDKVSIRETRPLSKDKRWTLVGITKKAQEALKS
jgi:small subunit ribosomal protein S17